MFYIPVDVGGLFALRCQRIKIYACHLGNRVLRNFWCLCHLVFRPSYQSAFCLFVEYKSHVFPIIYSFWQRAFYYDKLESGYKTGRSGYCSRFS